MPEEIKEKKDMEKSTLTPESPAEPVASIARTKSKKPSFFAKTMGDIFPAKISLAEQILLAKHLSMMLQSGISEVESLVIIKEQITNKRFKKILDRVITDLENGQFLSESLGRFQNTFGELFINVTKLGEISGTLPENLEYLAEEIKKKADLKSKVKSALIYPLIIFIATIGVTGVLVLFVLPKILPIFASLNVKLPLTTRILIATTNFINANYIWIILGAVLIIIALILLIRIPAIKYSTHRFVLVIPVAGSISSDYNMTSIARTLGLLLKSGIKIIEALQATANSMTNLVFRRALSGAALEVQKGAPIYKYLESRPDIFPAVLTRMIQIGERTGNLDKNLIYLSEFYENSLSEKVKNLSSIIEPILMIFMGLLVGFVALSIITPIYEVTQNIHP